MVIVLKMTVNGVAMAAVLSNTVRAVTFFHMLLRSDQVIHIEIKKLKMDWQSLRKIMQIGLPAGIQSTVFAVSNLVIQSAVNSLGTVVMAASSTAFNIEIFVYDILNSFSHVCTTFVGQNFGAGQIKRCEKILGLCLLEDAAASGSAIILILLFGNCCLFLTATPKLLNWAIQDWLLFLRHMCSLCFMRLCPAI
ncbi:MAG: hypothetical protein LUD81_10530 [Clostridiales bacterium]|nr:hypothetical protein [Clostridiales bacterium]